MRSLTRSQGSSLPARTPCTGTGSPLQTLVPTRAPCRDWLPGGGPPSIAHHVLAAPRPRWHCPRCSVSHLVANQTQNVKGTQRQAVPWQYLDTAAAPHPCARSDGSLLASRECAGLRLHHWPLQDSRSCRPPQPLGHSPAGRAQLSASSFHGCSCGHKYAQGGSGTGNTPAGPHSAPPPPHAVCAPEDSQASLPRERLTCAAPSAISAVSCLLGARLAGRRAGRAGGAAASAPGAGPSWSCGIQTQSVCTFHARSRWPPAWAGRGPHEGGGARRRACGAAQEHPLLGAHGQTGTSNRQHQGLTWAARGATPVAAWALLVCAGFPPAAICAYVGGHPVRAAG